MCSSKAMGNASMMEGPSYQISNFTPASVKSYGNSSMVSETQEKWVVTAASLQGTVESQRVGETLGLRRF